MQTRVNSKYDLCGLNISNPSKQHSAYLNVWLGEAWLSTSSDEFLQPNVWIVLEFGWPRCQSERMCTLMTMTTPSIWWIMWHTFDSEIIHIYISLNAKSWIYQGIVIIKTFHLYVWITNKLTNRKPILQYPLFFFFFFNMILTQLVPSNVR